MWNKNRTYKCNGRTFRFVKRFNSGIDGLSDVSEAKRRSLLNKLKREGLKADYYGKDSVVVEITDGLPVDANSRVLRSL